MQGGGDKITDRRTNRRTDGKMDNPLLDTPSRPFRSGALKSFSYTTIDDELIKVCMQRILSKLSFLRTDSRKFYEVIC